MRTTRFVLAVVTLHSAAFADLVAPLPERCPTGSEPRTGHAGAYCRPLECPAEGCPEGTRCEPLRACVTRVLGHSRGGPLSVSDVKGPCGPGDACSVGVCQTLSTCVKVSAPAPPSKSASRCNCELGPLPTPMGFAVPLAAVAALSLCMRRRARRRSGSRH